MNNQFSTIESYNDDELNHLLNSTLQNTFGLKTFRPGQREALVTLLRQKRLLCIQPTGHGKSLGGFKIQVQQC